MEVVYGQHDLARLPAHPHDAFPLLLALVFFSLDRTSDLLQFHLLLVEEGICHQNFVLLVLPERYRICVGETYPSKAGMPNDHLCPHPHVLLLIRAKTYA